MKIKTYTGRGYLCCILLCLFMQLDAQEPWIDINPGAGSANPTNLLFSNGRLYFTATNGSSGAEPFVIDCDSGVDRDPSDNITDLATPGGSASAFYTEWNGGVYFLAFSGSSFEIFNYAADGTITGMPFNTNTLASFGVNELTAAGNYMFFKDNGTLLKIDMMGTVTSITDASMNIINGLGKISYFNNNFFFQGNNSLSNQVLMQITDLNTNIAVELMDNLGESIGQPQDFIEVGGILYFIGNSPTSGTGVLYAYDGTNPPFVVMDASMSTITPVLNSLVEIGGVLYLFDVSNTIYSVDNSMVTEFGISTTGMSCDGSSSMNTPSNIQGIFDFNNSPMIVTTTGIYIVNGSNEIQVLQDGLTGLNSDAVASDDGSTFYFSADSGGNPVLWSTTSTSSCGTPVMQDGTVINPNNLTAIPNSDLIFFVGESNTYGKEIFKSNPSHILAVEFIEFVATPQLDQVVLKWLTALEIDNAGFEVERSKDTEEWETIGFVKGNGTTTEINQYNFKDETPLIGVNYYRLKQFDFDGTNSYSEIESVFFSDKNVEIQSWPNPVNEVLNYTINAETNDLYEVRLYDLRGVKVHTEQVEAEQNQSLRIGHLPTGNYYLKINSGTAQFVHRIVKQ